MASFTLTELSQISVTISIDAYRNARNDCSARSRAETGVIRRRSTRFHPCPFHTHSPGPQSSFSILTLNDPCPFPSTSRSVLVVRYGSNHLLGIGLVAGIFCRRPAHHYAAPTSSLDQGAREVRERRKEGTYKVHVEPNVREQELCMSKGQHTGACRPKP